MSCGFGSTHQNSALQVRGNPSEQQPPHQAGDGGKDKCSTQSPGHGQVVSGAGSVCGHTGQVTAAA